MNFPVALEGALKLKEISYIHAEAYAGGEMKHGPIALIDEKMPTMAIIPKDRVYDKMLSNIAEIKARSGYILAVADEDDAAIGDQVDVVIPIPATHPLLTPFLAVVPLQLFAYYIAAKRGADVDQPRNLAKSVTVESLRDCSTLTGTPPVPPRNGDPPPMFAYERSLRSCRRKGHHEVRGTADARRKTAGRTSHPGKNAVSQFGAKILNPLIRMVGDN